MEEAWPDHTIRSGIAITKLPLGRDILKKKKKKKNKGEMRFLKKNFFSGLFNFQA